MRNNTTPSILSNETGQKHSRRLLEAIRSNSYIQHEDTVDGDEDNEEDEEIEDIADAGQWRRKYNTFRHEIFVRNQDLIVDKLLSLNRTTKLKHRIVKMSEEQEECEFERQSEREDIFKRIKQLRIETKALGNVKKIVSYEQLEGKFSAMKEEQMKVFTRIDHEKCELEKQIGVVEKKIIDGGFDNRNEQDNEEEQGEKDSLEGDVEGEEQDGFDEEEEEEEGQDVDGKSIKIKKQKKNQEIDPDEDEVQEILRAAGVEPIEDSNADEDGEGQEEDDDLNNDSQKNKNNFQNIADDGCDIEDADSDNNNNDDPKAKREKQQLKNKEEDQVNKYESELDELKKKAAEISEKMKSLGDKNLGWLQEDHAEFLRIRCRLGLQQTDKANSNIQSKLIEECVNTIGVHSSEEVEEHAQLFQEFTALGEERKELLNEYKEKKSQLTKLLDERAKLKLNEDFEKREKARQRRTDELAKKKLQVANWRQSEEGRKREIIQSELEKQKILTAEAAAHRIHSEQSNRQQTKELIKQYKLKKQEENEKLQQIKAQQELIQQKKMRRVSLGEASRIKEKEEIMVKRKIILIQNLKEKQQSLVEENDNIERLKQLNKIKFPHIETRLSEPTKAAERRATQKYEPSTKPDRFAAKADSFGGKVLAVGGRLRLPTWRTPSQ